MTVVLDRYSQMVVAWRIEDVPPTALTVMNCLRQANSEEYVRNRYPGIGYEWACFGLKRTVYVDDVPGPFNSGVRHACEQSCINVILYPASRPRYMGMTERWFMRLSRYLHQNPGTGSANVTNRGSVGGESDVVMTLGELRASIRKWIVGDYSHSFHRALGCAPIVKWQEGMRKQQSLLPPRVEHRASRPGR